MILVLCLMMMPASGLGEAQLAENRGESIPLDEEPAADEISPDDVPEEEELEEEIMEGRALQYGDEGDDVLELQTRLKDLKYYTGSLSGRYREGTRAAVKTFQGDNGLEKTGIADPETQTLIFSAKYRPLRYGASGDEVKRLQARLTELGYYKGKLSGKFLGGTQKSLRQFQEKNGLTATGAADVRTQQKIYSTDAIAKNDTAEQDLAGYLVGGEDGSGSQTAATDTATAYKKTLRSGSSGTLVKQLQTRMMELGYYDGPISGNFAKKTLRAVKTIQTQNGLKATGQVDESTWNVIFNEAGIVMPDATPKPTPEPTPVPYAITVDVTNQVTSVYGLDENGAYTIPVRQMLCSTGTKANPSDVGDWVLNGRHAKWCEFPKWGNSYARYWTRINSNIAFHSPIYTAVSLDAMKTSSYKMLGNRASHGCIRLTVEDAKWIYENIGAGTVVSIREDMPSDPELRDALKLPPLKKGTSIPVETPVPTPEPEYDASAVPEITRKLKKNSEGPDVYWVQRRLQELGYYKGYAGGKMLNGTVNALKAFQKASGIYASGEVDARTMAILTQSATATETPVQETPAPTAAGGAETAQPEATPAPTFDPDADG
ncbi:MAG: peptidoglycan-binding protein [Clostridia bacterium]|nr:peptidoglycan-binding protein [Clostridia bacterium]